MDERGGEAQGQMRFLSLHLFAFIWRSRYWRIFCAGINVFFLFFFVEHPSGMSARLSKTKKKHWRCFWVSLRSSLPPSEWALGPADAQKGDFWVKSVFSTEGRDATLSWFCSAVSFGQDGPERLLIESRASRSIFHPLLTHMLRGDDTSDSQL